jgi:hypothetical protein
MSKVINYKKIKYPDFQRLLHKRFIDSAGENHQPYYMELALKIGKTAVTVRNCFQPIEQVVSDEVLTKLMDEIGLEGKIEWISGERHYCIKK